jgi:cytochrome c peroxidase
MNGRIKFISNLVIFATILTFACWVAGTANAGTSRLPGPVEDSDFYDDGAPRPAKVTLGKLLFFDKILSGNENISCATCHHPFANTGDGLSLPVGEGADGLGVTRDTGIGLDAIHERVPRNAPQVFNLGAKEFGRMFHDGRVEIDLTQPSGFRSPAGDDLPEGLENVLAVQAMFPVTSATEMAGQLGENSIADAAAAGNLADPGGVWEQLAIRLRGIPDYVNLFIAAFDDVNSAGDITYVHAANAIAAFEAFAWRFDNSPFDRCQRRDYYALSPSARYGMKLFYGAAGCYRCHSGKFQTDHDFHAIAMPQIGPGKGDGFDDHEDHGRKRVTGVHSDKYKFRTPSLRNVALNAPYGHAGVYNTLDAVIRHHLDSVWSLYHYDESQAVLPSRNDLDALDFIVQNDPARRVDIAAANELRAIRLGSHNIPYLIDFLHALTDPKSLDLRGDVPASVPSGLPVFD